MKLVFKLNLGAPGWLSWFSVQLRLRSWTHGLWVWAPHWALCWQLTAWSLRWFCVCLSLCPSPACAQSLSLKNKLWKKRKIQKTESWRVSNVWKIDLVSSRLVVVHFLALLLHYTFTLSCFIVLSCHHVLKSCFFLWCACSFHIIFLEVCCPVK